MYPLAQEKILHAPTWQPTLPTFGNAIQSLPQLPQEVSSSFKLRHSHDWLLTMLSRVFLMGIAHGVRGAGHLAWLELGSRAIDWIFCRAALEAVGTYAVGTWVEGANTSGPGALGANTLGPGALGTYTLGTGALGK